MVWRLTLDWLPDGDETKPEFVGHARICNLNEHEHGSPLGSYHAYFEANEVPMASNEPPYLPEDPRRTFHGVSTAVVKDYPRFQGSTWDLVATMLTASGRGWPGGKKFTSEIDPTLAVNAALM